MAGMGTKKTAWFRHTASALFGLTCAALMTFSCASPQQPMPARMPAPPPPAPAPLVVPEAPRLPTIQFTIQAGAFSTSDRAALYAERLEAAGLDAYYFIDTDGLYKVRFERFETREAALARALALQSRGLIEAFYIIHPVPGAHQADVRRNLQESIVETARRFLGIPYRWGGASVRDGFDCSGLTMTVYRLNGLELPRNAYSQYHAGTPVAGHALEPGDLVFFATGKSHRISHVGIYTGDGRFIHAPGRGKRIRTASLSNGYFKPRYKGARRYH